MLPPSMKYKEANRHKSQYSNICVSSMLCTIHQIEISAHWIRHTRMCHAHKLKPTHKNKIWHNGRVRAGIQTQLSQNETLVWHMHEFEPNYTVFKYMSALCTESKIKKRFIHTSMV